MRSDHTKFEWSPGNKTIEIIVLDFTFQEQVRFAPKDKSL
jgi:hypothetical protein